MKALLLKFSGGLLVAAIVCIVFATTAHAAEITPAPGTYSYGSTSEFSPYVALTPTSSPSPTLAPTGADQNVGYVAAIASILLSAGVFAYVVKNHHFNLLER